MGRDSAIAGSESETMLRALLDEANDAVLVTDDSGRYSAANRAAGLLFGLAPSDQA